MKVQGLASHCEGPKVNRLFVDVQFVVMSEAVANEIFSHNYEIRCLIFFLSSECNALPYVLKQFNWKQKVSRS